MNAAATPAPGTTAYDLRAKLWACRWIPVREEDPRPGAAGEWKRLKLLPKAFLSLLLNSIKANPRAEGDWCVPRPAETREERFFSKRRIAEALDCSRRTIQRAADLLVRLGLLARRKREWGANRWQVCAKGLSAFLAWNESIAAQVEEERIAAWQGRSVETLPAVAVPVVEPLHLSRAERRADAGAAPWLPRPVVGRLWGVFDLPELTAWALGRADWLLSREAIPEWAKKAEHTTSAPAVDFARLVLAWTAIVHGDCARVELLSFASGYARRLNVLWRGAGRPAPEELLPLIATVEWARLARVLDRKVIQGGRAGLVSPRAAEVLAPGSWSAHLQRALDARRAALAEVEAVVEARESQRAVELLQVYTAQLNAGQIDPAVAVDLARSWRLPGEAVEAAHAALVEAATAAERRRRAPKPG